MLFLMITNSFLRIYCTTLIVKYPPVNLKNAKGAALMPSTLLGINITLDMFLLEILWKTALKKTLESR